MSTRSGKRIHSSFYEEPVKLEPGLVPRSERKTRSKRLKENDEQFDVTVPKVKKRTNYVTYPTDDEPDDKTTSKGGKKAPKNTLKEQNSNIPSDSDATTIEVKKPSRVTRLTRKFADTNHDDAPTEFQENMDAPVKKKSKKKKGKLSGNRVEELEPSVVGKVAKKSNKKKKKSRSTSGEHKHSLNKSNTSTDSFHSAAGSPIHDNLQENIINETAITSSQTESNTICNNEDSPPIVENARKKRKRSPTTSMTELPTNEIASSSTKIERKKSIVELVNTLPTQLNTTMDKVEITTSTTPKILNATLEVDSSNDNRKLNTTFEKECSQSDINNAETKLNTTLEKEGTRESLRNSGTLTTDNSKTSIDIIENSTMTSKTHSLNSTYDKEPKLNSTYDKTESSKSSLITSDSNNLTFDKSDSRISITSDDSKVENIVNTTPVLIESSMDESKHSLNISCKTPEKLLTVAQPVTPLIREGTFTKEGPEVIMSPKPKLSEQSPRRMTLPSPGFTPFRVSTSQSSENKSVLNVTRSIEKPSRRSSLAEVAPRQTKVMFCSPVNNSRLVTQQKKKIIKSSMKGSNKSFVFEESESSSSRVSRKRSLTQPEEGVHKRSRLTGDLQRSVDRLSRPRTSSATAKLVGASTTPVKAATPAKTRTETKRTKLPNFAALHQKNFDKMESLDECQQRKARRAKQLLTPTAALGREISTPRGVPSEIKTKESEMKTKEKKFKPTEVVTENKLLTLESLRPGYTRFGFKMNYDINPFTATSKTPNEKPRGVNKKDKTQTDGLNKTQTDGLNKKEGLQTRSKAKTGLEKNVNVTLNFNVTGSGIIEKEKNNGIEQKLNSKLKKINFTKKLNSMAEILPSINGKTLNRKEIAKQTVMRENSFTSLSARMSGKRMENRTIIKGVRTNRRFELQMQMRNVD